MTAIDTMTTAAADELARLLRQGISADVWAIPTTADRNGRLHVGSGYPPELSARLVRPSDCGASTYSRWSAVPYSAMRETMRRACARDSILPLETA